MIYQQGHDHSQQQAKSSCGESAQRKSLQHLVHRDQQPAESKADDHAQDATQGSADKFRPNLADGITGPRAQAQKENSDGPKRLHLRNESFGEVRGCPEVDLCFSLEDEVFLGNRTRQSPNRLRLLLVTLKSVTISDNSAAISSFLSNFPANPWPPCTSAINRSKRWVALSRLLID